MPQTLTVVGIEGLALKTFAARDEVSPRGHRDRHKKSFEAATINAVVVVEENGEPADRAVAVALGRS